MVIEFRIHEKTRSLNESFRGDWRPRDAIAKRQRAKTMKACPTWPGGPLLVVRLTRVSQRELDSHDNLRGALKHVVDGVAARLKIDDASPLVDWHYHQTKGDAEVVVQIWSAGGGVAPPLPIGRPGERKGRARPGQKTPRGKAGASVLSTATADAGKRLRVVREPGNGEKRAPREFETSLRSPSTVKGNRKPAANYTPPRERPDDAAFNAEVRRRVGLKAAQEAEATFAPARGGYLHFRGASGACACGAAAHEGCR